MNSKSTPLCRAHTLICDKDGRGATLRKPSSGRELADQGVELVHEGNRLIAKKLVKEVGDAGSQGKEVSSLRVSASLSPLLSAPIVFVSCSTVCLFGCGRLLQNC
jgi:hypothetical protein